MSDEVVSGINLDLRFLSIYLDQQVVSDDSYSWTIQRFLWYLKSWNESDIPILHDKEVYPSLSKNLDI